MSESSFQQKTSKEKSVSSPILPTALSRRTALKAAIVTGGAIVVGLTGAFLWQDIQPHNTALYTFHQFVYAATWSPDGKRLATLTSDGALIVWDTTSFKTIYTNQAPGTMPAGAIQWSPDGHSIASSDQNHTVRIWNINDWSSLFDSSINQTIILALAWSPDSNYVAVGSANKLVRIYRIVTTTHPVAELVFTYNQHQDEVTSLAWAADNTFIASGSLDGTVRIWQPLTGDTRATFSDQATHPITAVACSPDSQLLAFTFGPKEDDQQPMNPYVVQVVHALSGNVVSRYTGHTNYIEALSWSPNGEFIASASDDTTVHIWRPSHAQNTYIYRGHTARVKNVAWSPDSVHLSTCSEDNTLQVWKNP